MRVLRALRLLPELCRVLCVLPGVELGRKREGPEPLAQRLRRRARRARGRNEREELRRVIRWVDTRMPGGPNCYRRVLLETRLDAGAARARIVFGLRKGGGKASGHAWLEGEEGGEGYEARFWV